MFVPSPSLSLYTCYTPSMSLDIFHLATLTDFSHPGQAQEQGAKGSVIKVNNILMEHLKSSIWTENPWESKYHHF